ncbi:ribonuclease M5 [Alicyclobacillus dauci]|uniref:Ribonuclease M5 n=1 Tax=Alicyclobacillus dauci TaxID=1475485 RepID=A0ABY6Z542_9BACL|nr:ribonuclease M5 [Alicyclobacillus dauci]WAH37316.1 ribonuclease M5 [Alicyclobacillus dauci]
MSERERLSVSEVIVVEGIHDKQIVESIVDADVMVLGGDRIGRRTLDALRRAVEHRGVIVLTDPDGAGERIRRRVDQAVPGCKHAHLPRAQAISQQGLGVEHARPEDVLACILRARPMTSRERRENVFTQSDMLSAGLVGTPDAADRRTRLGAELGIGYGNAKAFLHKLNTLGVTREEWEAALERLR